MQLSKDDIREQCRRGMQDVFRPIPLPNPGLTPTQLEIYYTAALTYRMKQAIRWLPIPPADIEAEQHILGCLLEDLCRLDEVGNLLKAEHFADPLHGLIFTEISERSASGAPVSAATLADIAHLSEQITELGGGSYFFSLVQAGFNPDLLREKTVLVISTYLQREAAYELECVLDGTDDEVSQLDEDKARLAMLEKEAEELRSRIMAHASNT
jgi:replicative DNA helicase